MTSTHNKKVDTLLSKMLQDLISTRGDTCSSECDDEVFKQGEFLCMVAGPRASKIDVAVQSLAKITDRKIDWHFFGGRGRVLVLGEIDDGLLEITDLWLDALVGFFGREITVLRKRDVE